VAMLSEQNPHLPALPLHENKALARSQSAQIIQFEFDLAILIRFLEKEDSPRAFPAIHEIIILRLPPLIKLTFSPVPPII
jgi:hypothetical protein